MKWKALFSRHRICHICGLQIKQRHRWKNKHVRILLWVLKVPIHRNCMAPETSTEPRRRLKGEVPLPFPDTPLTIHEVKETVQ